MRVDGMYGQWRGVVLSWMVGAAVGFSPVVIGWLYAPPPSTVADDALTVVQANAERAVRSYSAKLEDAYKQGLLVSYQQEMGKQAGPGGKVAPAVVAQLSSAVEQRLAQNAQILRAEEAAVLGDLARQFAVARYLGTLRRAPYRRVSPELLQGVADALGAAVARDGASYADSSGRVDWADAVALIGLDALRRTEEVYTAPVVEVIEDGADDFSEEVEEGMKRAVP